MSPAFDALYGATCPIVRRPRIEAMLTMLPARFSAAQRFAARHPPMASRPGGIFVSRNHTYSRTFSRLRDRPSGRQLDLGDRRHQQRGDIGDGDDLLALVALAVADAEQHGDVLA